MTSETNGAAISAGQYKSSKTCTLFPVSEPPSVVTPLADLECYVTETLMLTTEVRGQPCPEAHWVIKPFL